MKTSKRTITFRSLTTLLAIVMALMSLPLGVFASSIPQATEETPTVTDAAMPDVYEVVERREESVKHFRLADGSYVAAQYESAVHELDEDGNWQDIDNTLTDTLTGYESGSGKVKFANNSTSSKILSIKNGDYQISFGLVDAAKSRIEVLQNGSEVEEGLSGYEALATLTKLISKVRYADVYENADLEYVLSGNNIKENIVLKAGGLDSYSYSFEMKLKGLSAALVADGSIILADEETGVTVYTIPAPYMYDAAGEYSGAVQYALTQKNSKYTLTVTADADWINSEGRAFPVTVDPTIGMRYDIEATYISSRYTSTNYYSSTVLYAGVNDTGANHITLLQILTLPTLPTGSIITEATLDFSADEITTADSNYMLYLSEITTAWDAQTVTYSQYKNGTLKISSQILDYQYCLQYEESLFDITKLVNTWYSYPSRNHGVAIFAPSGTVNGCLAIINNAGAYIRPQFNITYRDIKGLENYYSYHSLSADGAGAAYVNLFNGQLTFVHDSLSTTDSLLPYTFGLVYNGVWANKDFNSQNAKTTIENSTTGYGFKLYTDETVMSIEIPREDGQGYYIRYVWSDGDGTEHYFKVQGYLDGGNTVYNYCDEDGLKLHLIVENNGYALKDDLGNIKHFNTSGRLDYIQDMNGNKRNFVYTGEQLTSINLLPKGYTTPITQLTFVYSDEKVSEARNVQTGLKVNFTYENGLLTQITYTYSTGFTYTVVYTYDANNRLIRARDLKTGKAVVVEYSTNKISTITEYGNATENTLGVLGQNAEFTYGSSHTLCNISRENDSYNEIDDFDIVYNFDKAGRAVSIYTVDGRYVYSSSNYTYEDDSYRSRNSLLSKTTTGGVSVNLLTNPGFDRQSENNTMLPLYWDISGSARRITDDSVYFSENAYMELSTSATQNLSNVSQVFKLGAGTYTFSASIARGGLQEGTIASLLICDSTGAVKATSGPIKRYDANMGIEKWERISVTFTVASTDTDCEETGWRVVAQVERGGSTSSVPSYFYVDSAMLEEYVAAGTYSSIGNGGFETNTDEWELVGRAYRNGSSGVAGDGIIYMIGSPLTQVYAKTTLVQEHDGTVEDDSDTETKDTPDIFILSGWAQGSSIPRDSNDPINAEIFPTFALKAVIHYYNTSETSTHYVHFNAAESYWQYASAAIATPPNAEGKYRYVTSVDIYCCYDYNAGTAYFDNVSFIRDSNCITHYSYNSKGYTTGATASDGNATSYTYDNDDVDATGVTTSVGSEYDITYDDHKVQSFYDNNGPSGYRVDYVYDSYGNVIQANSISLGNGSKTITTKSTYATNSSYFGAILTETDAADNTVTYFYNEKGQLYGLSDANGDGLTYQYDVYGRLMGAREATQTTSSSGNSTMTAISSGSVVSYTYDERGWLDSVSNGSVTYNFTYDAFGKTDSVAIGNNMLASYVYENNNRGIKRQTYGNGFYVDYQYDKIDRITGICYNGIEEAAFTYAYNTAGLLSEHIDNTNGVVHSYSYDADDRLVGITMRDQDNNLLHWQRIEYDTYGRPVSRYHYFPDVPEDGSALSWEEYVYVANTNYLDKIKHHATGTNVRYDYDAFGRISEKSLTNDFDSSYITYISQNYTYRTNGAQDLNLIGTVSTTAKESNQSTTRNITYTYDNIGNINSMTATVDGEQLFFVTYAYDAKSQLVREDFRLYENESKSFTKTYTYDNAGNLLYTRQYAYTIATPSGTHTQTNYAYGNTVWKDQLTAFNGKTITYDAIGNPLTYDGATYTWQGRQLMGYTKIGTTVSYQYNAGGIRTTKIVNGIRHEYYLNGSQIIREVIYSSNGAYISTDLRYSYDGEGNPCSIHYYTYDGAGNVTNDVIYLLTTNTQGDVTGIYSSNGNLLYTYLYDAWGNLIHESEHADGGEEAAAVNPFRYRGYYYDTETGYYYLNSRYYNPEWGRFLNADGQLALGDFSGLNLYAYCGNNPVNRIDPLGDDWCHWVIAGAIVVGCAAATVFTCGGFAAAATAVGMVACGGAAFTTASTVAATAFIASSTVLGAAALNAAFSSDSLQDFADQGSWETVVATGGAALLGGGNAYFSSKGVFSTNSNQPISRGSSGRTEPNNLTEKLAMEQVRSNPSAGVQLTKITLNDPRWPSSEGWVKMQQIVPTSKGDVNIHYVYNPILGIFDDFKFKS